MSTLIIALVVVGLIVLVCWLFITIERKQKRKEQHALMHRVSQVGVENSLSFSSQELLKRHVLGVDGVHRKLLILNVMDDGSCSGIILHLDGVKSCSLKRYYGPIDADALQLQRLEQHLQRVVLQFELKGDQLPITVIFYDHADNPVHECRELEQRARDWETLFSKMLKAPLMKRA
jgi:hypothetical protein